MISAKNDIAIAFLLQICYNVHIMSEYRNTTVAAPHSGESADDYLSRQYDTIVAAYEANDPSFPDMVTEFIENNPLLPATLDAEYPPSDELVNHAKLVGNYVVSLCVLLSLTDKNSVPEPIPSMQSQPEDPRIRASDIDDLTWHLLNY